MNLLIGLIIGLLAGWLIEWLIDWRFWQSRNKELRDALAEAEAQIAALKEGRQQDRLVRQELVKAKKQLASFQHSNRHASAAPNQWPSKAPRSQAQPDAWQEMDQPDTRLPDQLTRSWADKPQNRPNRAPVAPSQQEAGPEDDDVWGENGT